MSRKCLLTYNPISRAIFSTAEKGFHAVTNGIKNTFGAVAELSQLRKEYQILTEKLENYEQMQRTNAEIRKENERLKEQLDFTTSLEEKNYFDVEFLKMEIENLTIEQAEQIIKG